MSFHEAAAILGYICLFSLVYWTVFLYSNPISHMNPLSILLAHLGDILIELKISNSILVLALWHICYNSFFILLFFFLILVLCVSLSIGSTFLVSASF